ncbi:MAG: hypothetical protein VYA34_12435 [Myxococcota bacterium]|nr:hypothetical protein [Myxococcota bacterium]
MTLIVDVGTGLIMSCHGRDQYLNFDRIDILSRDQIGTENATSTSPKETDHSVLLIEDANSPMENDNEDNNIGVFNRAKMIRKMTRHPPMKTNHELI